MCNVHEQLPGEYSRENVSDCPEFTETNNMDKDIILRDYLDDDEGIANTVKLIVDKILVGYEEKFKVMLIGIARKKIKSILTMTDMIDNILDRLNARVEDMNTTQYIRLLSELNISVNNDISYIMKLVSTANNPKDITALFMSNNNVINLNSGSSPTTDIKASDMLSISSASRDKIRDAFDAILNNVNEIVNPVEIVEDDKDEY